MWTVITIIPNPYDPRQCKTLLAVPQCDAVQGDSAFPSPPSVRPFILQLPWLLHRHVDGPKVVQEPLILVY